MNVHCCKLQQVIYSSMSRFNTPAEQKIKDYLFFFSCILNNCSPFSQVRKTWFTHLFSIISQELGSIHILRVKCQTLFEEGKYSPLFKFLQVFEQGCLHDACAQKGPILCLMLCCYYTEIFNSFGDMLMQSMCKVYLK